MKISYYKVNLEKRFPLAISRGVNYNSENIFLCLEKDGIKAWGEAAPGKTEGASSADKVQQILEEFIAQGIEGKSIQSLYDLAKKQQVPPCAYVALDTALWDWTSKKAGLPLYQMLGFSKPQTPTSVTIGINPPEVVKERVPLLLDGTTVKSLKIKLGSPQGIDADKAMFEQVVKSTTNYDVKLRVDANGGWDVAQAQHDEVVGR